MPLNKVFFYLKDVNTLIEEATKAGGTDLGLVITPAPLLKDKPQLQVSYFVHGEARLTSSTLEQGESFTNPIAGCPYPPRC